MSDFRFLRLFFTMTENKPKTPNPVPPSPSSNGNNGSLNRTKFSMGQINPPETVNPDAATLRNQWRYAIREYSKWYSHAWGTAIFAGLTFFALGWVIKGENPISSFHSSTPNPSSDASDKSTS
ncbi:hypothetical protein Lal_00039044 [Lupinus albus]|uniref:Putative oxidoreductase n=1 Tax=Lupinus albus TaxID=3870 RepID=A0A6A4NQD9_LUPAL|nr:putative oxidoreductase [Lupinus albus]KAF1882396.1 hypothetical protein Lal_00039044 [Lupinus albus]